MALYYQIYRAALPNTSAIKRNLRLRVSFAYTARLCKHGPVMVSQGHNAESTWETTTTSYVTAMSQADTYEIIVPTRKRSYHVIVDVCICELLAHSAFLFTLEVTRS